MGKAVQLDLHLLGALQGKFRDPLGGLATIHDGRGDVRNG
jgi:hypothetical protein